MKSFLSPAKHLPLLPKEKIDSIYKSKRFQVFIGIFIGYAGYYLVRKNFSLAMPYLENEGFTKASLGFALSANAIAYGLSKFFMGGVSDRSDARKFLALGLILSSLVTLVLGTSLGVSSITIMFILQFLIGWFQGMGWPPCGRVMTHWFSQNERGTKMSF
ncbi:MFS transporter [Riemerella anatipestifer]|nr:MFS transporter [Riemerella anatipestifer]QZO88426.1 MFS transporter [Riemerella anatipestifer]QZO96551.1 MFS transporter [Riemerella anatipestifer]